MAGILPKDKQTHFSIHLPAGFLLLVKQHTTVGRSHAPRRAEEAPVFTASALCRGVGRTRRAVCRPAQGRGSASNPLTPEQAVALSKMVVAGPWRDGNSGFVQAQRRGRARWIRSPAFANAQRAKEQLSWMQLICDPAWLQIYFIHPVWEWWGRGLGKKWGIYIFSQTFVKTHIRPHIIFVTVSKIKLFYVVSLGDHTAMETAVTMTRLTLKNLIIYLFLNYYLLIPMVSFTKRSLCF